MKALQRSVLVFLVILPAFFSSGCTPPKPESSRPVVVTWKAKGVAVNDTAFLDRLGEAVRLRVYSAGVLAFEVEVNDRICTGHLCMGPEAFNEEYLQKSYPPDTVKRLLLGLPPAFPEAERTETENGVKLTANRPGEYEIIYIATPGERLFRDRLNRIIIRIKELE